jgi:NAD(P)-dependent dehydrogenase (short-subunit alcohol dehydrogenase family)
MPSVILTDMSPVQMRGAIEQRVVPLTRAAERLGNVEDIADAVLLLTSEKSRWVTGQTISVSGGITGN